MNTRSDATPFGSPLTPDKENIMADATDDQFVTFLDSNGETISNDPRWHAKRVMDATGTKSSGESEKDDIIAQLQEQLRQAVANGQAPQGALDGIEDVDDDEDEANYAKDADGNRTYEDVPAKELGALLKPRGISVTKEDGSKLNAKEARAALIADDAAQRDNEGE